MLMIGVVYSQAARDGEAILRDSGILSSNIARKESTNDGDKETGHTSEMIPLRVVEQDPGEDGKAADIDQDTTEKEGHGASCDRPSEQT